MSVAVRYRIRLHNVPELKQGHYLQEKGGVYLTRNGRFGAWSKAAVFEAENIAQYCWLLWLDRLKARWTDDIRAEVEVCTESTLSAPPAGSDAVQLLARARAGCFASNKQPPQQALDAAEAEIKTIPAKLDKH